MLTFRARVYREWIAETHQGSLHQQIKKSHYNKYFTEQACSVRIEEYWSRFFFEGIWTSPVAQSINLLTKRKEKKLDQYFSDTDLTLVQ